MIKFKIGDNVISLKSQPTSQSQPRIKGHIYKVNDVMYCKSCGLQSISITTNHEERCLECECGAEQHNNYHEWTHSKYFALANEESISLAIEEALNNDDYDTAILLRDLNIN